MADNKATVELDLYGDVLSQFVVDDVLAKAHAQNKPLVDITIKNVSTQALPRLLVDHGDVIYLLVDEIRRLKYERDIKEKAK